MGILPSRTCCDCDCDKADLAWAGSPDYEYFAGASDDRVEILEEDRKLLARLDSRSLLGLAAASGRAFCVGSAPDPEATSKVPFGEKQQEPAGDQTLLALRGLGYTCRKGKKTLPNQDSWVMLTSDDAYSIYGVFDGHGQKGHDVSELVKRLLVSLILKDRRFLTGSSEMLRDCFKKCHSLVHVATLQDQVFAAMSGTTATVAIHDHLQKTVVVAHTGDSSAVLLTRAPAGPSPLTAKLLTREHRPGQADERARIERAGGTVLFDGHAHRAYVPGARYPGLNMSRCIGDLLAHTQCGLTAEPEVTEFAVSDDDVMLLICSDGVWDVHSPEDVAAIVGTFGSERSTEAVEALAKSSWDRWLKEEGGEEADDITALLVNLHP